MTTRYDVAEHLRTPEEMAAYLEASFEEANGDAAFIAKALGDIARAKGTTQELNNIEVSPYGLHWPDLDEDLSFSGLFRGDYGQFAGNRGSKCGG